MAWVYRSPVIIVAIVLLHCGNVIYSCMYRNPIREALQIQLREPDNDDHDHDHDHDTFSASDDYLEIQDRIKRDVDPTEMDYDSDPFSRFGRRIVNSSEGTVEVNGTKRPRPLKGLNAKYTAAKLAFYAPKNTTKATKDTNGTQSGNSTV